MTNPMMMTQEWWHWSSRWVARRVVRHIRQAELNIINTPGERFAIPVKLGKPVPHKPNCIAVADKGQSSSLHQGSHTSTQPLCIESKFGQGGEVLDPTTLICREPLFCTIWWGKAARGASALVWQHYMVPCSTTRFLRFCQFAWSSRLLRDAWLSLSPDERGSSTHTAIFTIQAISTSSTVWLLG